MGSQQVFCLRWSNHQSNMLSVFDELLQTEALVDVTIACEGLSMKAHKVVLSACSPYFQTLFLQNPCKHPIVILKDIKYSELKALIDFMYKGEVNVTQEQLSTLLKSAETLKIKGLAEVTGGVNGQQQNPDRSSDRVHPGNNDRRPFHSVPPPPLPTSDSRSSSPHASASYSGQLASSRSVHSPPSKRKKMKRRASEANHSDENSEHIEVCGSPEMLETKVEVEAESADNVPSRSSDHDDHTDQPSDLQTDSNQESLDNYTNQGPTNLSNDDYPQIGEPMPALSPAPISILQKLKSPGPSTSGGGSIQGYIKSGIANKYTTLGGLLLPSQNWDLQCKPVKREPISSSLEVDIKYEQTLLEFAAQAAAAASDNTCPVCGITFRYRNNLYRHRRTHCDTRIRHGCHLCGKTFSRKDTLQLHARVKHQVQDLPDQGRVDESSHFEEVKSETPEKERSEGSSHFGAIKLDKTKTDKAGEKWPTHFLGVVKSESISKCE